MIIGLGFSIVKTFVSAVKQHSRRIIYLSLGCLACIFIVISVPIVSQIQLPNPIKLGVRTLAYPIGNDVHLDKAGGFCGAFGEQLKQKLAWWIKVEYVDIENEHLNPKYPRYNGLRTGKIHIECGPNSKSSQDLPTAKEIKFSKGFYETGLRLLLKKGLEQNLSNIKIGVVEETTTLNVLQNSQYKNKIKRYKSGDEVLDALDKNEVQAFASDALIVWTLLEKGVNESKRPLRQPYKNSGYHIFPNGSYLSNTSRQQYAVAVKRETKFDKQLLGLIDNTLNLELISQTQVNLKTCEDGVCIPPPGQKNGHDWKNYLIQLAIVLPVLIWLFKLYRDSSTNHVTNYRDFLLVFLQVVIGILTPNQGIVYVFVFSILLSFIGLFSILTNPNP